MRQDVSQKAPLHTHVSSRPSDFNTSLGYRQAMAAALSADEYFRHQRTLLGRDAYEPLLQARRSSRCSADARVLAAERRRSRRCTCSWWGCEASGPRPVGFALRQVASTRIRTYVAAGVPAAKCLALAGIQRLTLLDDDLVREEDPETNVEYHRQRMELTLRSLRF